MNYAAATLDAPRLLAGEMFQTQDPVQAEAYGSDVLTPHRLRARGATPFNAEFDSAGVGATTFGRLSFNDEVWVDSISQMDSYFLLFPLHGSVQVSVGNDPIEVSAGCGFVVGPNDRMTKRLSRDSIELVVKIPPATLHRQLGLMSGKPSPDNIQFKPFVSSEACWLQTTVLAVAGMQAKAGPGLTPQAGNHLEATLTTALLTSQPHQYIDQLRPGETGCHREAVERAAQLLSSQLECALDLAQLAETEGLTVRELQDGFRRVIGAAPASYLRTLRLDEAHQRLNGTPACPSGPQTVADIAYGVGFTHLGRFAAAYRARFGVAPSTTLSKSRRAKRIAT